MLGWKQNGLVPEIWIMTRLGQHPQLCSVPFARKGGSCIFACRPPPLQGSEAATSSFKMSSCVNGRKWAGAERHFVSRADVRPLLIPGHCFWQHPYRASRLFSVPSPRLFGTWDKSVIPTSCLQSTQSTQSKMVGLLPCFRIKAVATSHLTFHFANLRPNFSLPLADQLFGVWLLEEFRHKPIVAQHLSYPQVQSKLWILQDSKHGGPTQNARN